MPDLDRLVARKARLTNRLIRRDLARDARPRWARTAKPERNRTLLRVRIYEVDRRLDGLGYFDA